MSDSEDLKRLPDILRVQDGEKDYVKRYNQLAEKLSPEATKKLDPRSKSILREVARSICGRQTRTNISVPISSVIKETISEGTTSAPSNSATSNNEKHISLREVINELGKIDPNIFAKNLDNALCNTAAAKDTKDGKLYLEGTQRDKDKGIENICIKENPFSDFL